jgi:nuclear GTP-binding protein
LADPEDFIDALQACVKREHIAAQYGLPKAGDNTWKTSIELMEMISRKSGRLLKGGDPCLRSAAINLINDFQRGRLPHYVAPPELKEEDMSVQQAPVETAAVVAVQQDLDAIGVEHMEKVENDDDANEESVGNDDEEDQKSMSKDKKEGKVVTKKAESSDSEDEEEAPTVSLIGAGEWED